MISLIKRNSCGKALDIARMARDMLGGKLCFKTSHLLGYEQSVASCYMLHKVARTRAYFTQHVFVQICNITSNKLTQNNAFQLVMLSDKLQGKCMPVLFGP